MSTRLGLRGPTLDTRRPQAETSKLGRKGLQSGFSLLARGEPKIWFTGGMLVVCLAMIAGLIGLILAYGLPSFWPRPIDLLVLNDGTLEIGQLQAVRADVPPASSGSKTFGAGDANLKSNSAESAAADSMAVTTSMAEQRSDSAARRRYYRTGNFKLTGRHYRWLGSTELGSAGIARPEWAMVVERLTWGRLYGLPLTLSQRLLPPAATQHKLQAITQLQEILSVAMPADDERRSKLLQELELADRNLTHTAIQRQVANYDGSGEILVQTDASSNWIPFENSSETDLLTDAIRRWNDDRLVIDQLQRTVESASELREELEATKYRISRLDAQLSELRVDVRRAEIETDTQAAVQVDTSHYLLEQQEFLKRREQRLPELRSLLPELFDSDRTISVIQEVLASFLDESLRQEAASINEQLDAWKSPLEAQPRPIREAVQRYLEGYRAIVRQKVPLERRLTELDRQLSVSEIEFALPVGSRVLTEITAREHESLRKGEIPEGVLVKLSSEDIELTDEQPGILRLSDALTIVSLKDRRYRKRLLAVTRVNYLNSGSGRAPSLEAAADGGANQEASDSLTEPPAANTTEGSESWQVQLMGTNVVGCREIVRAVDVNHLGLAGKLAVYGDRWREFLVENPREANTEGGVFPAIWGTVVMTLIMTIVVVPFGVMAALYLREYTRSGTLVSIIRISINNLAGVPSIVYGVFGFSFFCYTVGAFIDGGPRNADLTPWPSPVWYVMFALAALLGTASFFFSVFSGTPTRRRTELSRWMSRAALVGWLSALALLGFLILKSPFFSGFYEAYLPNPTFGKGGLLWASLTLALLTLPVVIVATEEALAAVPNSLREGSLACGASKWQTIWRIVLPHARPGILTGAILAMARGAGEVAPLMLVGALPSAPDLPVDTEFPFFHFSRSFMHLGYQIFTLGFNSQNSEAAKPMVFTCTLLLILIVATLNLFAIFLRARLKRRFQGTQF